MRGGAGSNGTTSLHFDIMDARNLYCARKLLERVTVRVLWAQDPLKALMEREVLFERAAFLKEAAESIFFSSRFDACERYDSAEEFAEELAEEVDTQFERRDVEGVTHYVVRPFFNGTLPTYNDTPYDRLRRAFFAWEGVAKLLAVERYVAPPSLALEGLTEHELETLTRGHLRRALERVNLLRNLRTVLHYARRYLDEPRGGPPAGAEVAAIVAQLEAVCTLEGLPEPATFFGTQTDRTNPLKTLPAAFVESWGRTE